MQKPIIECLQGFYVIRLSACVVDERKETYTMKKTSAFIKGIAILMAISLLSVTSFAAKSKVDVWENIKNSYYVSQNTKTSKFNVIDDELLLGSEFIPGTIAPTLSSVNLSSHKNIKRFMSDVKEKGLKDSLLDTNTFLGVVKGKNYPVPSTAFIQDGIVSQVMMGDKGELYLFNVSNKEKRLLSSSKLNLKKTTAYFVFFDGFANGIVFDDGTKQMLKIYSSYKDIIPEDTILSLKDFLDILKNSEKILTENTDENKNLDPVKPNVTVG